MTDPKTTPAAPEAPAPLQEPSQDPRLVAQVPMDAQTASREVKSVGVGGGVVAGVAAGAAVGTLVGGPLGAVVGGTAFVLSAMRAPANHFSVISPKVLAAVSRRFSRCFSSAGDLP